MPKIIDTNVGNPAFTFAASANYWRFAGLEITTPHNVTTTLQYGIVELDPNGWTSVGQVPDHIVFDRCYVHGTTTGSVVRAFNLSARYGAVIDSYVSECHDLGVDTQAIATWSGPGPFKIVNNYLQAAGENVLFGGAATPIPNLVPSDIECRRNYLFKPLLWRVGDPSYGGIHWAVKNIFELKNARRILFDGNVLENEWADAQPGSAILFTPRGEAGTMPWAIVADVTFTNNVIKHVSSAFDVAPYDDTAPSQQTARILIKNNVLADVGAYFNPAGRNGWLRLDSKGIADLVIDHNTMFEELTNGLIGWTTDAPPPAGLSIGFSHINNIAAHAGYGISGDVTVADAISTLNTYYTGWAFLKNAVMGGGMDLTSGNYPTGNFFPATWSIVQFVNFVDGRHPETEDYHLAATSPYKNAGTDGKDLGADINAVSSATLGTTTGAWAT